MTTTRARRDHALVVLKESQRKLEEAQRIAHLGHWERDLETDLITWSDEIYRIFGLRPQERRLHFSEFLELIGLEDRTRIIQTVGEAVRNLQHYAVEYKIVRSDGDARFVRSEGDVVRDESGRPLRVFGILQDITERKEVENALRQRESQLRLALDTIPTMVWTILPGGSVDFLNKRWLEYTGLSLEEAIKDPTGTVHPEDLPTVMERWVVDMAAGRSCEYEMRLRRADGEYRWFLVRTVPMLDEQGKILKWFGANTDIEDRKRTEEALRESEARFRDILELMPAAVYVCDQSGTIQRFNPTAADLWGRQPRRSDPVDRFCGSWRQIEVDGSIVPHEKSLMALVLGTGTPVRNQEAILERPDGSRITVMVNIAPLWNQKGEQIGAINCFLDISERRRAEEALRQAQGALARVTRATTVGELTASIAHEINQPLGAVVTNADACLHWLSGQTPNLNEAREALHRIIRDGTRASEVVARIRSLLKHGEPVKTRFSLDAMIGEIVALTEAEAQRREVSLQTRLEPNLPPISADRVQLQQVLLNLVMNSMDALSEVTGRPRLVIIEARNEPAGAVCVAVHDTGIGIDPEREKELFEPFYTTKPDGLGLGLSISRSIIEAHGGRLQATPNDGPGVRFSFTLPVGSPTAPRR